MSIDVKPATRKLFLFTKKDHPCDFPAFIEKWKSIASISRQSLVRKAFETVGKDKIIEMVREALVSSFSSSCVDNEALYTNANVTKVSVKFLTDPFEFISSIKSYKEVSEPFREKPWASIMHNSMYHRNHFFSEELNDDLLWSILNRGWESHSSQKRLIGTDSMYSVNRTRSCDWQAQAICDCLCNTRDATIDVSDLAKIAKFSYAWSNVLPLVDALSFWKHNEVLILEPASAISFDSSGRIHNPDGPAIVYPDRDLYILRNMVVDKKWIATPRDELDIADILAIRNAEIRMAVIERMTREIFNRKLFYLPEAEVIQSDSRGYTLLSIPLRFGFDAGLGRGGMSAPRVGVYLKMVNPTTGVTHVEPVGRECTSIQQAINWRQGGLTTEDWRPSEIT